MQKREFCQDFLQFVLQYPLILDWLPFSDKPHFHPDSWHGHLKRHTESQSRRHITPLCKTLYGMHAARSYWTNVCGGHHNKPGVPAATAKWGHSRSRACGHISPAGWSMPTYRKCHLGSCACLFGSNVLSNWFAEVQGWVSPGHHIQLDVLNNCDLNAK